jgi:hypothetical protein
VEIEELEKFMQYAKVANPPYNPSEHFLCITAKIKWLERRILDLEGELDHMRNDDEDYED